MATIKDNDGKEIEVFTAEEVEAQKASALEAYQKEHPDQGAALTETQSKLDAATKALEAATAVGGDDKDKNFAALRGAVKAAEIAAEKARTDALAAIDQIKNAPNQEHKTDLLDLLSAKDAKLKEKIEIHYKNLSGMPEGSRAEVRARMEAAFKLAADQDASTILDGATGMGNRGTGGMPQNGDQSKESDNGKLQRGVLGIPDDVAAKYAPKPGQPGYRG